MADLTQSASTSVLVGNQRNWTPLRKKGGSAVAFGFLIAFFIVYCGRPEDWILYPLRYIPLAKITAGGAILALLGSGKMRGKIKELPREATYLMALIVVLFISAVLSPVWRGGAIFHTIEFSKIIVIFALMFFLITDLRKMRQLIIVQSAATVAVVAVSVVKGYQTPRLEGVIGGVFSNPNDLAFAIVLSIPYCLALMLTTKSVLGKLAWGGGIMVMLPALFLTASRAGFIDLVVSGGVCLWHFGVRGRRLYLLVATALLGTLLLATAGQKMIKRFEAIEEEAHGNEAYGSFEARKMLMIMAVQGIEHYPILGIGVNNFASYTHTWQPVHMTYLQIAVEGGIPALFLYLAVFWRGFQNLRRLNKQRKRLDPEVVIFTGAVHSALVGFAVGALFSPEAYHFFPFFAVAYTSVLMVLAKQDEASAVPVADWRQRRITRIYGANEKQRQPRLPIPR